MPSLNVSNDEKNIFLDRANILYGGLLGILEAISAMSALPSCLSSGD